MMKKNLLIASAVLASCAAVWLLTQRAFRAEPLAPSEEQKMKNEPSARKNREYTGSAPLLAVGFRYPADWAVQEESGRHSAFRQVRILGPRNASGTYRCYMAVMAAPSADAGGTHADAKAMALNYTSHLQQESQILNSKEVLLAGARGRDLLIRYTQPEMRFNGVHKPGKVPVKVRTLIVQKGSVLYQLTFSADAIEYDRYAPDFDQLLHSFRFL